MEKEGDNVAIQESDRESVAEVVLLIGFDHEHTIEKSAVAKMAAGTLAEIQRRPINSSCRRMVGQAS